MTLLELLVNELVEWPDDTQAITQIGNGDIRHYGARSKLVGLYRGFDACADYRTSIITRAQWEEAKGRVNMNSEEAKS